MMASEYNDLINQQKATSQAAQESGIADQDQTQLMRWKQDADEYSHKFSVLAEGGIQELLALHGIKSTYKNFKASRDRFRKFFGDAKASVGKVDPTKPGVGGSSKVEERGIENEGEPESDVFDSIFTSRTAPAPTLSSARGEVLDPFRSGDKPIPDQPPVDVDIDDLVDRARADTTLGGAEPEAPLRTGQVDSTGMRFGQSTIDDVGGRIEPPLDLSVGQTIGDFKPIDVQALGVRRAAPQLEARLGGGAAPPARPPPAQPAPEEEDEPKPEEPDIPPAQSQTYETRVRPKVSEPDVPDPAAAVSDVVGEAPVSAAASAAADATSDVASAAKSTASKLGEQVSTDAVSASENLAEKFTADEMLGAVAGPIGEGIATVAGIFTTIDGLVHIFNHSASPIPTVKSLGDLAPALNTSVTSKYSSAIPTVDSAHQMSASVMSF